MKFFLIILFVAIVGAGVHLTVVNFPEFRIPSFEFWQFVETYDDAHVLFVGDIMLGRNVEVLGEQNGTSYSFRKVEELIRSADLAVGNFEGTIPQNHIPTQSLGMTFSIEEKYMQELHNAGIDVLSLANNHALDYGPQSYENTLSVCSQYGISCFGHPLTVTSSSTSIKKVGDTTIGFLFMHTLFTEPDLDALQAVVTELKQKSDFQIVFVHWGNEYELLHSYKEEGLAHLLIDNGIDAVIGHHPHVIQDIEIYNDKPIFYSLGNFIFDQYFSDEVQKGLGIDLMFERDRVIYTLIPFSSKDSRSQPYVVTGDERMEIYKRFEKITDGKYNEVGHPYFVVSRD